MEIFRPHHAALERKIQSESYKVLIGGMTPVELEERLIAGGIRFGRHAHDMIRSEVFSTLAKPEEIRVARLTPEDFGFSIEPRAKELSKVPFLPTRNFT